VDFLFFGNSHIGNGVDLNIISVKTKANVNTIYSSGQVLSQIYYSFKETLKYQSPNLMVIETFSIPADTIYYFKDPVKESEVPFNAKIQSFDSKRTAVFLPVFGLKILENRLMEFNLFMVIIKE
jgi:hypothetical protein